MTNKEDFKKEVHQCRSCKQVFRASERKEVQVERYGLVITEKVCPHCGSHTYGLVEYPVDEFDLLYKSNVHRNQDKKLRNTLDKMVDEIFDEDNKGLKTTEKTKQYDERCIRKYNIVSA